MFGLSLALTLKRGSSGIALDAQIACAPFSSIAFNLKTIRQEARLAHQHLRLINLADDAGALLYLLLQLCERRFKLPHARQSFRVLCDQLVIARELSFSTGDTLAHFRGAVADQTHGIAQALGSLTVLFHLQQSIKGGFTRVGREQKFGCERALRDTDGGTKQRLQIRPRLDA